jgi:hypothetical protein
LRIAHVDRRNLQAEPVIESEVESEDVDGKIKPAISSALRPTAMVQRPVLRSALQPSAAPGPASVFEPSSAPLPVSGLLICPRRRRATIPGSVPTR